MEQTSMAKPPDVQRWESIRELVWVRRRMRPAATVPNSATRVEKSVPAAMGLRVGP